MGAMKLISMKGRTRNKKKDEEEDALFSVPYAPRAAGPLVGDLPAACPAKASEGCLRAYMLEPTQRIWEAVNTGHAWLTMPVYAAWAKRRGALFMYRRMVGREMQLRDLHFTNVPLHCREFSSLIASQAKGEGRIVQPINAAYTRPLDTQGRMTPLGFKELEDVEFVWPWLDEVPQHTVPGMSLEWIIQAQRRDMTYLALGLQHERLWDKHFIGGDSVGRPMAPEEPSTFALAYAQLLKEAGRAGPGTRLGKWLDVWLERADKEMKRLSCPNP